MECGLPPRLQLLPPRLAKPLSHAQVKRAKATTKLPKLFAGNGLYLEVHAASASFWRCQYRWANSKETTISLGQYPEVSLAVAWNNRTQARRMLLDGLDRMQQSEKVKRKSRRAIEYSLHKVAMKWWVP
jgi:hypothetical protein